MKSKKYQIPIIKWFRDWKVKSAVKHNQIYEIQNVKQNKNEPFRKLFINDYFDLYVWFEQETIVEYQLYAEKNKNQKCITWKNNGSISISIVDEGDQNPGRNRTPLLINTNIINTEEIMNRFKNQSNKIDKEIRKLVLNTLKKIK